MPKSKTIGSKQPDTIHTDRHAVRVVALKSSNEFSHQIALLPGGDVEIDEDHLITAEREVKEETGAVVAMRNSGCIATTEEYHNDLHQISYCYIADVTNAAGSPSLTEEERVEGLSHQ
ncbi:hypothetical protein ACHAQJ_001261 [Trichoderma viride]